MDPFREDSGFTLIEVMISSSLILIAALAFAEQASYQNKVLISADTRIDVQDLKASVGILLSQKQACFSTLGGKGIGDTTTGIHRAYQDYSQAGSPWIDEVAYAVSATAPATPAHLYIQSATITGTLAPGNTGQLNLSLVINQTRLANAMTSYARDVILKTTLDLGGKITDCQTTDDVYSGKALMCSTPATDCLQGTSFCAGELYPNVTKDCLCFGAKTSGVSTNGTSCNGASPLPIISPTATPSPSPTPTPSPTPPAMLCSALPACGSGGSSYLMSDFSHVESYCNPTANLCKPGGATCSSSIGQNLVRICATAAPSCPTAMSGGDSYYSCP